MAGCERQTDSWIAAYFRIDCYDCNAAPEMGAVVVFRWIARNKKCKNKPIKALEIQRIRFMFASTNEHVRPMSGGHRLNQEAK